MSKAEARDSAKYDKARAAFKKLEMQDKAAFVLEATFSTFGEAFKDAGQQFADVMEKVTSDDFFKGFAWECDEEHSEGESKGGKSGSGRKKSEAGASSRTKKDEDDA